LVYPLFSPGERAGAAAFGDLKSDTTASSKPAVDPLADKETFLNLLVAQLKNQNPLNPLDGMQFVTQLAQFSQLEQLLGIRGGIDNLTELLTTPAATTTTSNSTGATAGAGASSSSNGQE
jgi:flagellar basal-body rod modification protein FlgD